MLENSDLSETWAQAIALADELDAAARANDEETYEEALYGAAPIVKRLAFELRSRSKS